MAKFADYGFNKCHAAPYALVAYQTAWMKANHPVAFIAACMSLAITNTDKLAALRQEAARMGIRILPPDVNRSGADFTLERDEAGQLCIRYALAAVKKVGFSCDAVAGCQPRRPPLRRPRRFRRPGHPRQLNKMQIENLARAGAFDGLEKLRARVFAAAETILRRAQATVEERDSGQIGLFGAAGKPEPLRIPNMPEWDPLDRPGLRGRGDRLPPHRPSARRLWPDPQAPRRASPPTSSRRRPSAARRG